MTDNGRSLELFFIDGDPDGMLTAEVFNWTGHVLKTPRTRIKDALARDAAKRTGVYLLTGDVDGKPMAYIGEDEDVSARIRDHDSKKDWWTDAVMMTTTADNLHKAHVKYLEARLVEIARDVGAAALENGNTPVRSSLSEASQANMEEFLETLFIVLPALGIDMFASRRRPKASAISEGETPINPQFTLRTPRNNIEAQAMLQGSDFVVLKGSIVRQRWEGKGEHDFGYAQLHRKLVADGVIIDNGSAGEFTENYAFNSPSAAAAVVNGRPANGRLEWKLNSDGRSYKDWEADQLQFVSDRPNDD